MSQERCTMSIMLTSSECSLNVIFQVPVSSETAGDLLGCTGCVCVSSHVSLSNLQVWNSGRGNGGRESSRPGLFHRQWRQEADGTSCKRILMLHHQCTVTVSDVCVLTPAGLGVRPGRTGPWRLCALLLPLLLLHFHSGREEPLLSPWQRADSLHEEAGV